MGILKNMGIGFLGLMAIGAAVEKSMSPEQRAAEEQQRIERAQKTAEAARESTRAEEASLQTYTASQLARAYSENTVAADQVFKGRKYKISGTVKDINTDIFGNPYLVLRGGENMFMEPQFGFESSGSGSLSALRKGMKVNLICMGHGDVAKTPMSGECILL